jgi:hypothetical protein
MSARDRLGLLGYEAHTLIYDVRKTLRRKQAISTDEADQVEEAVEGLAVGVEGFVAERRLAEESAP